ncbi:MAG: acyl-CoA dehydrogenase [Myxococcota bacterium]|nr:acyl-CoA dehydrogenase [Myxococcota bacterium]
MLDFGFTAAQEDYRATLRELALRELLPRYARGDAEQVYPKEQVKRVLAFSAAFWAEREEEPDLVTVGITAEEVARGDFNAVLMSLGPGYTRHFLADADPTLLDRWLPGLATGDQVIGLCLTEPGAGSDMAAMAARAEPHEGGWRLFGVKNSVSFLNADVFYVFARTDPDSRGWRGISAFLVPRDAPGLSFETWDDLGCRAVPRGVLTFDGVEVGRDAMVGEPGLAFASISRFFDVNRAVIGLKCIGAAMQSIDETIAYTKQRRVFGAPLASNQAVSFGIAEDVTSLELARWQCYRVLWMRQNDIPCRDAGAMVKWYAPKRAAEAVQRCLRLHGHYGYSKALPHQQRLRDILGWQIGDGSEEVMKLLIARARFGREIFEPPMRHDARRD